MKLNWSRLEFLRLMESAAVISAGTESKERAEEVAEEAKRHVAKLMYALKKSFLRWSEEDDKKLEEIIPGIEASVITCAIDYGLDTDNVSTDLVDQKLLTEPVVQATKIIYQMTFTLGFMAALEAAGLLEIDIHEIERDEPHEGS